MSRKKLWMFLAVVITKGESWVIKEIPSSLYIKSILKDIYNNKKIGTGFVASHVWRVITDDKNLSDSPLGTRNPITYSFIPNLVWLPSQVSRLTDREGSFTQLYLQALSYKIYRNVELSEPIRSFVEEAWSKLKPPTGIPIQGLPEIDDLNFFDYDELFVERRIKSLQSVEKGLELILQGEQLTGKIISSRYTEGLAKIEIEKIKKLKNYLSKYLTSIS